MGLTVLEKGEVKSRIKDDSQNISLSNWVGGGTIYWDEEEDSIAFPKIWVIQGGGD